MPSALTTSAIEIFPLTEEDLDPDFACGADDDDLDLRAFFLEDAARLQRAGVIKALVAYSGDSVAGYVASLTDLVRLKAPQKKRLGLRHDDHPAIPAIKIARLAVSTQMQNRGIGRHLVRAVYSIALSAAENTGCRLVTVDAKRKPVPFYLRLGFEVLRTTKEDLGNQHLCESCPYVEPAFDGRDDESRGPELMRLDILKPPAWLQE